MTAIRVLIVEDRPSDAELMVLRLQDEGFALAWERVDTETAYLAALETGPDIVISDWHLPLFSGLRALELLRARGSAIPFVIVSGYIGEEAAIDALRRGADDYVLKDRPARIGPAVRGALEQRRLQEAGRRADAQLRLAATVFESSVEGVMITDADGTILAVNRAFTEITGYDETEAIGRNPRMLQSGRNGTSFYRDLWATLLAAGRWRGEVWNRRKDGQVYPEWMTISAVASEDGRTGHYVGVFTDVGDFKKAQQDVDFLVHHDPLTGLPNRTLILDRLDQARRRAAEAGGQVAVLVLDLDHFGDVNDGLGHRVGDQLLRAVALRTADELGAGDSLGRLASDEFVILLDDVRDAGHVALVARDIVECLALPFGIEGHEIAVSGTVGISLYPADGHDPSMLLDYAEAAMRQAKALGRGGLGFYDTGLAADMVERLAQGRELRSAAARGELVVYYQPQVDLADGSLVGAEALVRWQRPAHGIVMPGAFIPLAEELGIIGEIGAWVLAEACRQVATWDTAGLRVPRLAVNLSAQQLDRANLAGEVQEVLDATGIGPERLELEVTESMVMHHAQQVLGTLASIRDTGVGLAIDDFGTGFSSLTQLRRLMSATLKIDISFVRDIGVDQASEAIIRAIIALAAIVGSKTVAEGIEREDQADFLRLAGCRIAQGYLFGHPVPAEDFFKAFHPGAGGA